MKSKPRAGKRESFKAYAATRMEEYFAENCEAYFGVNDFLGVVALTLRAKRSRGATENSVEAFGGPRQLDGVQKRPHIPLKVTCQPTLQSSLKASAGCVCDR